MEFMFYLLCVALFMTFIVGGSVDYFMVKTGRVVNQENYTLDDIKELKHRGFLFGWSAYSRFKKVGEVSRLGFKEKQRIFNDL